HISKGRKSMFFFFQGEDGIRCRNVTGVQTCALPILFISAYHYLLQKLPSLQEVGASCGIVPCNTEYVNYFGFITIPFLAGTAFIVIFTLHIVLLKQSK